ncbi:hypothetical protein JCM10908_001428 [Rhodotorula pacifica]|uniref:uncharacterized protein n=1 Tax=Rhodotorula pacifica TaxID=1495444 RepID=UPI00317BBB40
MARRTSSSSTATDRRALAFSQLRERQIPSSLPHDILSFLLHYPFLDPADDLSLNANLKFYQDRQAARPRRARCTELQDELRGNWDELEWRHDFVQWFFPIREQGVNWEAQPLQPHEVEAIKADPAAMSRLLESYRIMLAFYGLRLVDETTGELDLEDSEAAPSPGSYLRGFRNLETNSHNFLRITRVLKCLGEFGLERYPPAFLLFILALQSPPPFPSSSTSSSSSSSSFSEDAASSGPYLDKPSLIRSFDTYWRWCIRDDSDREFVIRRSDEVRKGDGSWTVKEYRQWVRARAAMAGVGEENIKTEEEKREEDSDEAELVVTPADQREMDEANKLGDEEAPSAPQEPDVKSSAAAEGTVNAPKGATQEVEMASPPSDQHQPERDDPPTLSIRAEEATTPANAPASSLATPSNSSRATAPPAESAEQTNENSDAEMQSPAQAGSSVKTSIRPSTAGPVAEGEGAVAPQERSDESDATLAAKSNTTTDSAEGESDASRMGAKLEAEEEEKASEVNALERGGKRLDEPIARK